MRIGLDATPIVEQCAGIGNYVKELLRALVIAQPENEFYLYVYKKTHFLEEWERFPNVTVCPIPRFSFSHALWVHLSLPARLRKDRIQLFWGTAQSIPLVLSTKIISLLSLHDFVYLLDPSSMTFLLRNYFKILMPFMIHSADFLLANSLGTATRLELYYNYKADGYLLPPLKKLFSHKSEKEVSQFLSNRGLSYKNYFLMVGTIEPRKNIEQILSIYRRTLEQSPDPENLLPIVLIGGGGWKNSILQEELRILSKGYPDHFKVLGFLPDPELNLLMNGARSLMMLSRYEGYGMPLAEARACGTPVIATDIVEMREAAEGEGIFISLSEMEKALPQYLMKSSPVPRLGVPSYPSNREKIQSLIEIIEKIATSVNND